jgi:hypothetical protein
MWTVYKNPTDYPGLFVARRFELDKATPDVRFGPTTDGNGRSGRALWLWCMRGRAPLGFLHQFYYQTLGAAER